MRRSDEARRAYDSRAGAVAGSGVVLMIKYIGSKRMLVPAIVRAIEDAGAALHGDGAGAGLTVLDLFSGTSRVGHALKARGHKVIANDHNAYAHALARCYVEADSDRADDAARLIAELNTLPGKPGYFTQTFCEQSRYVQPFNGERIDAIREAIAHKSLDPVLESIALVSLMEAADRVDSTTGLQMAYLKSWSPRSHRALELRVPALLPRARAGAGEAHRMDAMDAVDRLEADVAYIDPPYNQHSYLGNYHVWESLVTWDKPAFYGVACKRTECQTRRSVFNSRAQCARALEHVISTVRTRAIVVSISDEGFVRREQLEAMLARRGQVRSSEIDHPRYVGAKIGIYSPSGVKVGKVGKVRNTEYLLSCTP